MFIETRPKSDPARWARVHLQGDRSAPFETGEPAHPFWLPTWAIRKLMRRSLGGN